MQMSPEDIKAYAKLQQHVSTVLPALKANNKIIDTIWKLAGTICREDIKDALDWGKGPMVKVADLGPKTLGAFTPGVKSNEIRIATRVVTEVIDGKGQRTTPAGELVELVTVTLLHELTHWADDQDGVDTPGEEGELFEQEVYGKVIV